MKTLCLTLHSTTDRLAACRKHFAERGIEAEYVYGIHAKIAGLVTVNEYNVDHPEEHFNMGPHGVGIWCGFIMCYTLIAHGPDEHVLLVEHDANFDENWKPRFDQAMKDVPPDFDFLFIGSCCAQGARKSHVKGEVWEVKYPMCNHACVIAKKCMPFVLETIMKKCWAPIDIQLAFDVFPKLKVYTALPRMAVQFDTEIQP